MRSATICLAIAGSTLLALTQFAVATGTSGGAGVVATIPSSVVRAREQAGPVMQPGLVSIITGSTLFNVGLDPKQNGGRRGRATKPLK